ncbi:hypothetical protein FKM82_007330 [Ascaphus truei]
MDNLCPATLLSSWREDGVQRDKLMMAGAEAGKLRGQKNGGEEKSANTLLSSSVGGGGVTGGGAKRGEEEGGGKTHPRRQ